jgi:hypothetical protein
MREYRFVMQRGATAALDREEGDCPHAQPCLCSLSGGEWIGHACPVCERCVWGGPAAPKVTPVLVCTCCEACGYNLWILLED